MFSCFVDFFLHFSFISFCNVEFEIYLHINIYVSLNILFSDVENEKMHTSGTWFSLCFIRRKKKKKHSEFCSLKGPKEKLR